MASDILDITEKPIIDDSIERYEYHEYEPRDINLNTPGGEIRINIETQDLYTQPAESYLLFKGRLVKAADGAAYADADLITLTNNAMMYCFSQIKYELGNQQIECLLNPGQATTMLGLLKYPADFSSAQGLNQCWVKDTSATAVLADNAGFAVRQAYIIQEPTAKGTFSFYVPLKHIFGFCEDYNKIVWGFKHTLTLNRASDNNAIYRDAAADAGKIVFSKISWFMPHIDPALAERAEFVKQVDGKISVPVAFTSRQSDTIDVLPTTNFTWSLGFRTSPEKPRYLIIGFQTAKYLNQTANAAIFDHIQVKNAYVMLNQERYPQIDYDISFSNNEVSRIYNAAAKFSINYYGMNELITHSNITPSDFKKLFPIFVFDLTRQRDKIKSSVIDMRFIATFEANAPANTKAYALLISDKFISFKADGSKMMVETQ